MKTVFEHVEHIKGKPHHVRKQVSFSIAAAGTALVSLIWLATSLSTGAFAIKGSSFAESVGQASVIATGDTEGTNQNIAGAAAAFPDTTAGPPRIQIVNTATSSPIKKVEQTVLPF